MSGHSKWSTIKRQKGAKDSARGAIFTKLGNAIAVAARNGIDPETNFSLKLAIDRAKATNMPSSNIERSINRSKEKDQSQLQEVLYEGYGPGGVAIIVEAATDNVNRTYPNVKTAFSRHGGSIAEKGAVLFNFDHVGVLTVKGNDDQITLDAIEAGAKDVAIEDDSTVIYTDDRDLSKVRDYLIKKGYKVQDAELTYEPKTVTEIDDQNTAQKILRLMDSLEDLDDVIATHVNFNIADNVSINT